jgi:molybdopterin synthase sulfur carrier subunit
VVRVLYFAALRELTGRAEEELELPAEVRSVRDLTGYLQRTRPVLAGKLVSVRVALDETFASDSDALADVQVIALIPPVAGG